ncbi:uncharacterized protein LOC123497987 [Portunus trituberculatus]|uniref:uncharacterized protein LOC123497987 n=1 Tax=Portunus trituberculatus TaxID=210409 RepID=UPI001E1D1E7B|nr:uncharacterized protein LOC123497987 [Portunus trituberculatus]
MGRVLPCQLLLLLLLGPSSVWAPSFALSQDCNAADTVVKEGQTRVINTIGIGGGGGSFNLFVKPGSDFEGVRLEVQASDGTHHAAWFPAEEECFPRDGTWLQYLAGTWVTEVGLSFRFRSNRCWKWCVITTQGKPINFSVVAHGRSGWIKGYPPDGCNITYYTGKIEKLPTCQELIFTSTTNTTTTLSTPALTQDNILLTAASTMVVLVVVVVVAVVLVVDCRKRNSMTLSNEVAFQSQPDVASRALQFTTSQGRVSDQDQESFCCQIRPDRSARRVAVPRPVQDLGKLVYDDVLPEHYVLPRSPFYENVPPAGGSASPHGHLDLFS